MRTAIIFLVLVAPVSAQDSPSRRSPAEAVRILQSSQSISDRTHARYLAPEDLLPRPSVSVGARPLPSTPITPSYRGPFVHQAAVPTVLVEFKK